jgi:hypothetical protein
MFKNRAAQPYTVGRPKRKRSNTQKPVTMQPTCEDVGQDRGKYMKIGRWCLDHLYHGGSRSWGVQVFCTLEEGLILA